MHQSGTYDLSIITAEIENVFDLIPFHLITIIQSLYIDILPLSHTTYDCQ